MADYALMILLVLTIKSGIRIRITKKTAISILIILIGAFLSLFLNILKQYFSVGEYMATFIKLIFYLVCTCMIPQYIIAQRVNIIKCVRVFMHIAVIGAVIQLLIVWNCGVESWPLYSLGSHWFGINTSNTMLVNNGLIRARSFFTEPSIFVVAITLAFVLLLYQGSERFNWSDNILYVIGIVSANSFSGYGMAILIYAIYFFQIKNHKKAIRMIWLSIPGIIAIVGIATFNSYLMRRVINLFALKDTSGVVRTIGGFHFLGEIPPYGVGLGNHSLYYHSLNLDASELIWYSGSGEFYNIILVSIITMGYIGAMGLLLYQFFILKKNIRLFCSLLVTHFATGRLFTTPLWVFLILYLAIIKLQNQNDLIKVKKYC